MQDLGLLPGGSLSHARAINDRGEIVGWGEGDDSEIHAILWRDQKAMDLGTLGDMPTSAWGINNQGQIVGTSSVSSNQMHAFLWEKAKNARS